MLIEADYAVSPMPTPEWPRIAGKTPSASRDNFPSELGGTKALRRFEDVDALEQVRRARPVVSGSDVEPFSEGGGRVAEGRLPLCIQAT